MWAKEVRSDNVERPATNCTNGTMLLVKLVQFVTTRLIALQRSRERHCMHGRRDGERERGMSASDIRIVDTNRTIEAHRLRGIRPIRGLKPRAAWCRAQTTAGSVNVTVVPSPSALSIDNCPPCASTSARAMANPRPLPP